MLPWPAISGLSLGWLAAGAAAAAIPILIHLWAKRRAPIIVFPAARFARNAVAGSQSRRRLRDRALLTLRALVMILLALAFARPLIDSPSHSGGAIAPASSLVILLDASASMQRTESGVSLFESAKERAKSILAETQAAQARAAVILITADPRPLLPRITENIPYLISEIDAAQPTLERGEALRAITLAETLLDDEPSPGRRAIVVLSDMQATQWREMFPGHSPNIDLRFEIVSREERTGNIALGPIAAAPARPIFGQPVTLAATVRNLSDDPRSILVHFTANDLPIGQAIVSVPAWSEREALNDARFDASGDIRVKATIAPDDFRLDNEATATIAIADWPRVALVMSDPAEPPAGSADWFIRAALTASAGLPPTVLGVSDLAAPALAPFDSIVIAESATLTEPHHEALRTFAERGGVVLRFVSAGARSSHLDDPSSREDRFWPLICLEPAESTGPSTQLRLVPGSAVFEDNPMLGDVLRGLDGLEAAANIRSQLNPGATSLVESDRGPAVARRTVGGGATVDIALGLDPSRSALVREPHFPALIHALMEAERATSRGGAASMHLDQAESDLRTLTKDEVRTLRRDARAAASTDKVRADQPGGERPIEVWHWLLAAALGILAAEGWLRQRRASSGGFA